MRRGEKIYLGISALIIILLVVMDARQPLPIDWTPNLSSHSRTPYGTQLVYERLSDIFKQGVRTVSTDPYEAAQQEDEQRAPVTRMFVQTFFTPSELQLNALLAQAENGDDVFIAAAALCNELDSALHLVSDQSFGLSATLTLRFLELPQERTGFVMEKTSYSGSFSKLARNSTTLAVNGSSEPIFIHVRYGKGGFWLCSLPLAFTNYHLLKDPNDRFISTVFSYLPQQPVLWDEHFKGNGTRRDTPLSWLLSNTATKWALYLCLALIALYMLFHSKREQRAIPIVEPLRNTSREFVGTIGNLYYTKGDHTDLAHKMIAYFKEELRQRTYLRQFAYDTTTYAHLSTKLGMTGEETARRFEIVAAMERSSHITEEQLLVLNQELGALRARL
jgi:hypothetical protein